MLWLTEFLGAEATKPYVDLGLLVLEVGNDHEGDPVQSGLVPGPLAVRHLDDVVRYKGEKGGCDATKSDLKWWHAYASLCTDGWGRA